MFVHTNLPGFVKLCFNHAVFPSDLAVDVVSKALECAFMRIWRSTGGFHKNYIWDNRALRLRTADDKIIKG